MQGGRPLFPPSFAEGLSSQETEEARLYELELGLSWRERTESMSAKDMKDILSKARVRQAAGLVGKHREAWARAKSPEGFWEVDMRSTQDLIKKGTRPQEKNKDDSVVRERWEEAMRSGGRWVFRDEV